MRSCLPCKGDLSSFLSLNLYRIFYFTERFFLLSDYCSRSETKRHRGHGRLDNKSVTKKIMFGWNKQLDRSHTICILETTAYPPPLQIPFATVYFSALRSSFFWKPPSSITQTHSQSPATTGCVFSTVCVISRTLWQRAHSMSQKNFFCCFWKKRTWEVFLNQNESKPKPIWPSPSTKKQ